MRDDELPERSAPIIQWLVQSGHTHTNTYTHTNTNTYTHTHTQKVFPLCYIRLSVHCISKRRTKTKTPVFFMFVAVNLFCFAHTTPMYGNPQPWTLAVA